MFFSLTLTYPFKGTLAEPWTSKEPPLLANTQVCLSSEIQEESLMGGYNKQDRNEVEYLDFSVSLPYRQDPD